MKSYFKYFLFFLIVCLCCNQTKAQYDTIYRGIKEIHVEKKTFLRSLKSASKEDYFCKLKNKDKVYTIRIRDSKFWIIQLDLRVAELWKAKGFFELNKCYYFVFGNDSLSDFPQGLFSYTDNQKLFMDLVDISELWWLNVGMSDGSCGMEFRYRDGKLYFIKNL